MSVGSNAPWAGWLQKISLLEWFLREFLMSLSRVVCFFEAILDVAFHRAATCRIAGPRHDRPDKQSFCFTEFRVPHEV